MSDDGRQRLVTAMHKAAHTVVTYRLTGDPGGRVAIADDAAHDPATWESRALRDVFGDSTNPAEMEARVVSLYAGCAAQQRYWPQSGSEGCLEDHAHAECILSRCGWMDRKTALQEKAKALVEEHWRAIESAGYELNAWGTLESEEAMLIAEGMYIELMSFRAFMDGRPGPFS